MSTHTQTLLATWSADMSITKEEIIDVNALAVLSKTDDLSAEDHAKLRALKRKLVRGRYLDSTYKLGKNMKAAESDMGRLCVLRGIGLQAMGRQIRGALAMANYHDVDIECAHPTLCLQVCKKQGISCEAQEEFIANRTRYINELCEHLQVDKGRVKERINALYFGFASASEGMPEFFTSRLHPELMKARELIVGLAEWTEHIKFLRGKENRMGRALSYIMQTIERSCLLEMDASATRNKRSLDVFIHDGGLIRKLDGEKVFPVELLRAFEDDIFNKTGFKVVLAVKPLTTDLDVASSSDANYTTHKKEFEKTCFKVNDPCCYVRIYDSKVSFLDIGKLGHIYANDFVDGELFINKWRADPDNLTYERVDFLPELPVPADTYNLWRGFPIHPVAGDVSVIQGVLRTNCNHDMAVFDWIENYVAHMFQKPGEKPGVCICFQSEEEGAGKETYWEFIGEILGQHLYFNTSKPEDTVFGRFNGSLKQVLMIKFEEADFETNKRNENQLKALITAVNASYESKNENAVTLRSYCRCIMTTNNVVPFVLTDTNRRFMMVQASPEMVGKTQYWEQVHSVLAKPESKAAYLDYLLNKDITGFNPRKFPKTAYMNETIAATRPLSAQFFQRQVEKAEGRAVVGAEEGAEPVMEVMCWKARDLFNKINENAKFPQTETRFGREMKKYMPTLEKEGRADGNYYQSHPAKMRAFLESKHWWVEL